MTPRAAVVCVNKIEEYWGALYRDDEIRADVRSWVEGTIDDTSEATAGLLQALKESCPLNFGPPDLATIKQAVIAYEREAGVRIRRERTARAYVPVEPTEEEREFMPRLRAEAEAVGIDVSKDGWLFQYMRTPQARSAHGRGVL